MESRDALYEWGNWPDKSLPEEIGRVCTDGAIWVERYDNEWVSTTPEQRLEIAKALLAVDGIELKREYGTVEETEEGKYGEPTGWADDPSAAFQAGEENWRPETDGAGLWLVSRLTSLPLRVMADRTVRPAEVEGASIGRLVVCARQRRGGVADGE